MFVDANLRKRLWVEEWIFYSVGVSVINGEDSLFPEDAIVTEVLKFML